MTMILAGSPEDSKTYKQLAKALGVPDTFPKSIQNVKLMIRSFYREVQRKNKKMKMIVNMIILFLIPCEYVTKVFRQELYE